MINGVARHGTMHDRGITRDDHRSRPAPLTQFMWSRGLWRWFLPIVLMVRLLNCGCWADEQQPGADRADAVIPADVIVAGGSTAALAAAFAAAEEGAQTVLIEPTDWIGGQLTASGVPAVDEAWHKIKDSETGELLLDVSRIARDPRNMTPAFRDMLAAIGNPGRGWVSRYCFPPRRLLDEHLLPWELRLAGKLTVYRQTVVKRVDVDTAASRIQAIEAIQRFPRPQLEAGGYDVLPSQDLPDWYDADDSPRFTKRRLRFTGTEGAVFIEATEWGELLALSGGRYLQGVDNQEGALDGNDQCGQATVFGFVQRLHDRPVEDAAPTPQVDRLGWGKYAGRADAWDRVWTYRRLLGHDHGPALGDLSLQNWGFAIARSDGGNDYPSGYLFLSKAETAATRDDWRGGVNLEVMAAAERRAYGWHHWFKGQAPPPWQPAHIALVPDVLGTGHGLAKLPYIRDTRRSIGLDGFLLTLPDLVGQPGSTTARQFKDTIAIGTYPVDVHHLDCCQYPLHVMQHQDTRPFCIPFRALTHEQFGNLLVAGKTMAQSFMANSATRLHPIEWSTGTAAGVSAAWMQRQAAPADAAQARVDQLRRIIASKTPVAWTLD